MKKRRTIFAKKENQKRERYLVDASGQILGRLASKVAVYLRGKHKPSFTPQTDCGDYIVVVNAGQVVLSADKAKEKVYFSHSGHPQGDKLITFEKKIKAQPEQIIRLAVKGMLPRNRLGAKMLSKLKIFRDEPAQYAKLHKLEVGE